MIGLEMIVLEMIGLEMIVLEMIGLEMIKLEMIGLEMIVNHICIPLITSKSYPPLASASASRCQPQNYIRCRNPHLLPAANFTIVSAAGIRIRFPLLTSQSNPLLESTSAANFTIESAARC